MSTERTRGVVTKVWWTGFGHESRRGKEVRTPIRVDERRSCDRMGVGSSKSGEWTSDLLWDRVYPFWCHSIIVVTFVRWKI